MDLNRSPRLIIAAVKVAFEKPGNILLFAALVILLMIILIAVPATTVPGNNFRLQASLMSTAELLLLMTLSALTALSIIFHLYVRHFKGPETDLKLSGQTGASLISGLIASIFGTATCAVCVSTLFGFLGFGAVLFLVKYRLLIVTAAIVLSLISLHRLSARVLDACEECHVPKPQPVE